MPESACDTARVWLSAFSDGEALPDANARSHIDGCAACTRWEHEVASISRRAAIRPATAPDVTGPALAAWRERAGHPHDRELVLGRVVVALAGAVGLALSILGLFGTDASGAAHLGRDVAALEAALCAGFLLAAARPQRYAAALLPVTGIAGVLTLMLSQGTAIAGGSLVAEASHIPAVLGFVGLLVVLDALGELHRPRHRPQPR